MTLAIAAIRSMNAKYCDISVYLLLYCIVDSVTAFDCSSGGLLITSASTCCAVWGGGILIWTGIVFTCSFRATDNDPSGSFTTKYLSFCIFHTYLKLLLTENP